MQRLESHLGEDERDDLGEVAAVATLEIAPAHSSESWPLNVVITDELGPRLSAAGAGVKP